MSKLSNLSIFFPLYNEEKNIEKLVKESLEVFPKIANEFEIILVNDGSEDNTLRICESLAKKHPEVKVISHGNRGYGGALKTGFSNAKYDWIFYSDGDLQFNLVEIKKFVKHTKDYDLIIGYRKNRAEGFKRVLIMHLLKIWNFIFFNFPFDIKDTDCAFKLLKKEVIERVSPLQLDGGLISTELLLKATKLECAYKQIPVEHKSRQHGEPTGDSVKVISTAIQETFALLKMLPQRLNILKLNTIWALFFLALLPISLSINYMQNDDYTHYRLVEQFLSGNFTLDPYLGATFYTQGLISTLFAKVFGIINIPVLTLIFSVFAVWVLSYLVFKYFRVSVWNSVLVGLLVFVSPLFLYSTWGFMTENYFMLFFVLSFWSFLSFLEKPSRSKFALTNILFFLAYGVRQFGLFLSLASALALLYKKKYKWGIIQLFLFGLFVLFHFYIFPQTPQMYDSRLSLVNLQDIDGIFTRIYIFGIYLGIFLAPFIVSTVYSIVKKQPKAAILLFLVPFLFFVFEKKFEPENVLFILRTRNGETNYETISPKFPYLDNIFTRKGFYEDNLLGDKYAFSGYFDLFNLMEVMGKILFLVVIPFIIFKFKKVNIFALFYSAIFAGVLVISPRLFDRYLLPLVFTGFLILVPLIRFDRITKFVFFTALLFWGFLGYQFSADNILVNKYIWSSALEISKTENVPRNKVNADHSWRQLYPNSTKDRIYHFTYADFGRAQANDNYKLVDKYKINYPFSFYKDPYIYLYFNEGAVD